METIFSRYSNDRADRFAIRTDIVKGENEKLYVRKCATTKQGREHIRHIYDSCAKLKDIFGERLIINSCKMSGDEIWLEYVRGTTLNNLLTNLLKNGNKQQALRLIRQYLDIAGCDSTTDFSVTEEFRDVFGNVSFDRAYKSAKYTDIDMVFDNIIIDGDRWTLIDYEWSFDFPIPQKFILYRAAVYFDEKIKQYNAIKLSELMQLFGISEDEEEKFAEMEKNFKKYMMGADTCYEAPNQSLLKKSISIDKMLENYNESKATAQFFFDYGEGFTEGNSYRTDVNDGILDFDIQCDEKLRNLRIDPADTGCMVLIDGIYKNGLDVISKITTNAEKKKDKTYIFENDDPQIIIPTGCVESNVRGKLYIYFVKKSKR